MTRSYDKEILLKFAGEKFSNTTGNLTSLETFYWRSQNHWANNIGYHWFLLVFAFIQHKWILYSWNYMDILIAVFARAMYFQFKTLYKVAKEKVVASHKSHESRISTTQGDSLLGTYYIIHAFNVDRKFT